MDLIGITLNDNEESTGMKKLGKVVKVWAEGVGITRREDEIAMNFKTAIEKSAPEGANGYQILGLVDVIESFYYDGAGIRVQYFTSQ